MNRQSFKEKIQAFTSWAGKLHCDAEGHLFPAGSGALARLQIDLSIPKSAKVGSEIHKKLPFFELTRVYCWRANGMINGTFAETRAMLARLSNDIMTAKNDAEALSVCEKILKWGGDRNPEVGATNFLRSQKNVLEYLNAVKVDLALNTAIISPDDGLLSVMAMNSMLTKIHALNADDGLPIYDSRVAGAIATLVETWRHEDGRIEEPLPIELLFPEVGGGGFRRSVCARYPESRKPGTLYYAAGNQSTDRATRTARKWASAKVRLGWLLSEFLAHPSPDGIRSLEASLFMAGYKCAAINQ